MAYVPKETSPPLPHFSLFILFSQVGTFYFLKDGKYVVCMLSVIFRCRLPNKASMVAGA